MVHNPQANAIVEHVHQTIGNMIRTFQVYDNDELDDEDPWTGILAAIMAAVRSTYSTTTQATPMQLVFGHDAIFNIPIYVKENNISFMIITDVKMQNTLLIPTK